MTKKKRQEIIERVKFLQMRSGLIIRQTENNEKARRISARAISLINREIDRLMKKLKTDDCGQFWGMGELLHSRWGKRFGTFVAESEAIVEVNGKLRAREK